MVMYFVCLQSLLHVLLVCYLGRRGLRGASGLPGVQGDRGYPGVRGRPGPSGPPGLGGCPLPDDVNFPRHLREVGHIISTTTELYNSLGIENLMSADEFYNYIMEKASFNKDTKPKLSDNFYSDEGRVARSTESSTDCNGVAIIPGSKGDQGIPGFPGNPGRKGESGIPGT